MLRLPSRGRSNNFDSLRFLAAVAVLVSHSFAMAYGTRPGVQPLTIFSRNQTDLGSVAVLVFFVISGYLITRSFDRSPQPLQFLEARVLRIFPGLFLTLVLAAALLGPTVTTFPLGDYFRNSNTAQYIFGGVSLIWLQYDLPGVFLANPTPGVVNGSLWTLYLRVPDVSRGPRSRHGPGAPARRRARAVGHCHNPTLALARRLLRVVRRPLPERRGTSTSGATAFRSTGAWRRSVPWSFWLACTRQDSAWPSRPLARI